MERIILYPVAREKNKLHTLVFAIQVAKRWNARLVLFSSLPESADDEELDALYIYLLKLNGFIQTVLFRWNRNNMIVMEKVISRGVFSAELNKLLDLQRVDLLLWDRSVYRDIHSGQHAETPEVESMVIG